MAIPIKPTPILLDKEAEEFEKKARANENKWVSMKDTLKILDVLKRIQNRFGDKKNGK